MSRIATYIQVYWDAQDRSNESWAYRASDDLGLIETGSLDSDADDLAGAIDEVISVLDVDLTADQFATSNDDGGYAVWQATEECM